MKNKKMKPKDRSIKGKVKKSIIRTSMNNKESNNKYNREKLKVIMNQKNHNQNKSSFSRKKLLNMSLRERMLYRLKTGRFRFINQQLYEIKGKDALKYFAEDKDSYEVYHEGYQHQVKRWPLNPLHVIIKSIQQSCKKGTKIADFGCGTAELAKTLTKYVVHSFDLVSRESCVTACDMAHTPLASDSVDIAVFCLSLMGTNLNDFIKEANRVLKVGGIMKIAEIESRFENVQDFITKLEKFGFSCIYQNFEHNLFFFLDFKKDRNIGIKAKKKLPQLELKPCLYKKR